MYELFIHLTLPNDYILPFLRTLDYLSDQVPRISSTSPEICVQYLCPT